MAIGLGVGFLLHRLVPAIDLGMATLIGVVTLGGCFLWLAGFRPWRPFTDTTTSPVRMSASCLRRRWDDAP